MALTPIFTEQTITFENGEFVNFSVYFPLTVGEKYTVIWDGVNYVCTAENATILGYDAIVLGNKLLCEDITTTSEPPFLLGILPTLEASGGFTSSTEPNHIVSLYYGVEESILVIQDRDGEDVTYTGVDIVHIPKTDGNMQIFSKGETMEKTVELDFSDGGMVITPNADKLFSSVTIPKPSTLVAENIRENVEVAGVMGTLVDNTQEELSVTLDFSEGNMVITPDEKKVFSKVEILHPETLIPENIAEGVNIAGIDGTRGGGAKNISTEAEMNALLISKNVGNVYRFVGETTTNYVNGDIYIVEEVE